MKNQEAAAQALISTPSGWGDTDQNGQEEEKDKRVRGRKGHVKERVLSVLKKKHASFYQEYLLFKYNNNMEFELPLPKTVIAENRTTCPYPSFLFVFSWIPCPNNSFSSLFFFSLPFGSLFLCAPSPPSSGGALGKGCS